MQKPIWFQSFTCEELNRRVKDTLCDHLGIMFTKIGPDFIEASMPVDRRTTQPMGILHGGASCALAETVGSAAANYCVDQREQVCLGLDINSNHIRSVSRGIITGIAHPLHLGKTTQVWEIKIYDEEKKLVSISRLTVVVVEKNSPAGVSRR